MIGGEIRGAAGAQTGRALVISPFATWPGDAGQRRRARQSTAVLQGLGYRITFLLYACEGEWYWRTQDEAVAHMRAEWGDVRVLHSARQVGLPPRNGDSHQLDEWWDPLLGEVLERLFEYETFDVVCVHNVWLSKALVLAPRRSVRLLDSHDVFYPRREIFSRMGLPVEFFNIRKEDELFGLARADAVLTIKAEEAELLSRDRLCARIVNLPYLPTEAQKGRLPRRDYGSAEKVRFGFLGSAHAFNISGVRALIAELDRVIRDTFAPIELVVGGTVCNGLRDLRGAFRPTLLGFVQEERDFYTEIDMAVVPVFDGTGFKVKVAELAALGQPFLCAAHAAEGIPLDRALVFPDPAAMAEEMARIAFARPPLAGLAEAALRAHDGLTSQYTDGCSSLASTIAALRRNSVVLCYGDRLTAASILRLIAAVLQARTTRSDRCWRILVPEAFGLDLAELNAVASPDLRFGCRTPDTVADALAGPDTQVFLDAAEMAVSDLAASLPSHVVPICDVRFLVAGPQHAHLPGRMGEMRVLLFSHQQQAFAATFPDAEIVCLPILVDSVRWDPCVGRLLTAWRARHPHALPRGRCVLTGSAAAAAAVSRLLPAMDWVGTEVLDLSKAEARDRILQSMLLHARGQQAPLEIIDALPAGRWIRGIADEIAALTPGTLAVRSLSASVRERHGLSAQAKPPAPQVATPSAYWHLNDRSGLGRNRSDQEASSAG
jgi:hypothetical protein